MGPCSQALRLSECPVSGVHTESNFMTVRQHEVCAKPEGSQSLPLTPEERLTETEGEVTSHTNADGAQTEGMVGTQAQELGRMPEPLVGPETRLLRGRGQAVGGAGVGMTEPKAGKGRRWGEAGKGQRDLCTFPPGVPAPRAARSSHWLLSTAWSGTAAWSPHPHPQL